MIDYTAEDIRKIAKAFNWPLHEDIHPFNETYWDTDVWHESIDWNDLMDAGDIMDHMITEGNWGIHEQFFSDEMHTMDNFERACRNRNPQEAFKALMDFIDSLEHQDPKIVKMAKKTET